MTREEASNILDDFDVNFEGHTAEEVAEAFDVAFRALEQEPCEDCISRQAVLEGIAEWVADGYADSEADISHISSLVTHLPSVTPKEKTGRWISFGVQGEIDGQIVRAFTCSRCGAISILRVSNGNIVNGDLCPNCGAKMVEP